MARGMSDRYARLKAHRREDRELKKNMDLVRLIAALQPKEFKMPPEHAKTLRDAVAATARKALEAKWTKS